MTPERERCTVATLILLGFIVAVCVAALYVLRGYEQENNDDGPTDDG